MGTWARAKVRETAEGLQLSCLSNVEAGCFLLMGLCILITGLFVASCCTAGRK